MPNSPLPNYLRTFRKRAGLSQEEVAFLIGAKSSACISRYERHRQKPNLRTLLAYEFILRTPIRELYGGETNEVDSGMRERIQALIRKLTKLKPSPRIKRKLEFLLALSVEG